MLIALRERKVRQSGEGWKEESILALTALRRGRQDSQEKDGKRRASLLSQHSGEEGAPCTNLFCPAVVETYAIHYGHLPVQRLLLPPELLLHLASFLDCLGDSIMVI